MVDFYAEVGGWKDLDVSERDEVLSRFQSWEKMTWKQILVDGKWRNHAIDVDQCCPEAQARLRSLKLDDYDQLVSLAVNSTGRVIGILDRATFQILWWDPNHQVCPSTQKHT